MQPSDEALPGSAQPTRVRRASRGFTDGAAVELFGIALAVSGLGLGTVFSLLGLVVAVAGLVMHFDLL